MNFLLQLVITVQHVTHIRLNIFSWIFFQFIFLLTLYFSQIKVSTNKRFHFFFFAFFFQFFFFLIFFCWFLVFQIFITFFCFLSLKKLGLIYTLLYFLDWLILLEENYYFVLNMGWMIVAV